MAEAAKFDLNDDSVVVIVGTGAGGGVLANELAQKGIKVVALEAGGRYLPEDYINDEWESFGQLAWTDPRTTSGDWRVAKDFSGLPAWIVKAVGGTSIHWAGASLRSAPGRGRNPRRRWCNDLGQLPDPCPGQHDDRRGRRRVGEGDLRLRSARAQRQPRPRWSRRTDPGSGRP